MQFKRNIYAITYFLLIIPALSSCLINLDINKLNDRMFKKYDKNLNHTFEQTEFDPILKNVYKFEKQSHKLINKNISQTDYLKNEFPLYDGNKDGHITLKEIQSYDSKKYFNLQDENKNGYLDIDNEISFLTVIRAYKSMVKFKKEFVLDGERIISYDEFKIKVKKGFDPNSDNTISLEEYENFMPLYCGCN